MLRSGISGSYVNSTFCFLRIYHTVFPFINKYIKQHLLVVDFLMMSVLTAVRCYLVLTCISLIIADSIFSCAYWPSVFLLWRNVCLGFLSIFQLGCLVFLLLSCIAVCVFWKLSLCQSHCLQIFSAHFIGCLLILLMVSFAVQKLVSFIRYRLFIFVFVSIALGELPKKTWTRLMSENVLTIFSSRSFIVSCLMLVFKPFCVCVQWEGLF